MTDGLTYPLAVDSNPAERAVISLALMAPNAIVDRALTDHQLEPWEFQTPHLADAWKAIAGLHADGDRIDEITVAARMTVDNAAKVIADVFTYDIDVSGLPRYVDIVRAGVRRRSWQRAARILAEAVVTGDEEHAAKAEKHLAAPSGRAADDTSSAEQVGHDVIDYLQDTDAPVAIPTGITGLDNRIGGGLRPGDVTAIGGWTSMGKSVFCDQVLAHARINGRACHAYINEMSRVDRGLRMLARNTGIPHSQLMRRDITTDEARRVVDAASRLPFGITDCSQWTAEQIARHIRRHKWDLCALDLLHNIPYDGENELHRMTSILANAARSAGTHLLLVCQLNEERAKSELLPVPVIRDIRGSGMVKNLAANVVMVHRFQEHKDGVVWTTNEAVLTAAKSRHGQQGGVTVRFNPDRMQFESGSFHLAEEAAA